MAGRRYDIVLYGASGFTGKQTTEYFRRFAPPGLRWAVAGRTRARLEPATVDVMVADGHDEAALNLLASQTRVVATTAGPFSLYGSKLVAACVANKTHYCDITGETPWIRGLIDRHHMQARADGTRIIPCCGFDSIPSDYGAWLASELVGDCVRVAAYFRVKGGLNGGTMASALHMSKSGDLQLTRDPFLLNPDRVPADETARNTDPEGPRFDPDLQAWVAPFFMGPINTRIVRRTQALSGGGRYDYQEYMRFDSALAARAASAAGVVFSKVLGSGFGRWMIHPLLPAPGEGPSVETMDTGFFECELLAYGRGGAKPARLIVKGQGDPGNRITVKCLCESAFLLAAIGENAEPGSGGVLTPVTGLGEGLIARLRHAGIFFERAS